MAEQAETHDQYKALTSEKSTCCTKSEIEVILKEDHDHPPEPSGETESPGPSGETQSPGPGGDSAPQHGSSDEEFSDPDPDPDSSGDEWLLSGSTGSSRASSPDEGDPGSRRDHSPDSESWSDSSPVRKRGRASSRGQEQDSGWRQTGWQPKTFAFTATPGPRNAAADLDSNVPADFLELFLTDDLLQHIVDHTNLYAHQHFKAHPDSQPHSRVKNWSPVSVPELKRFFGLSFLTGYVKKPNIEMYWSMDEIDATPFFNQTMSRNRFQIIWKFLHFNDNASQDSTDKLYKVRPVLQYIVEKFREMYQPGRNICIDEGMMQWRGRLSFRVYNPQKPVKCGIKSFMLCDSATGYCFNMQPYVGEASTLSETVFSLLDRLPGHGYTLYMDNFDNSEGLCERLLDAQTHVCGTLRKNSGEPKVITDLTKSDVGVGVRVVRHNEREMVVAWRDKQLVKMVTTCHQDKMQKVEVRQRGQKTKDPQFKPECVVGYNSCMNGVDKLDRNITYYPSIRRSQTWSKKFVAYLFQLCIFNAYVLYKARHPGECKTLLDFIPRVVKSWTAKRPVREEGEVEGGGDSEEGQPIRAPYRSDPDSRLDGQIGRHRLERLMPSSGKTNAGRRCRVCTRKGKRRETRLYCKACCVPLHAGECYTVYHTKQNYAA